ncbi:MAG: homoserine kinase [Phenylobacterium sp.]|uniref:homoserine kinase n=1 Tax=Phenylobacterium sp. TaxID=1871053 RepID=UPI0025F6B976|nr:homoserine kinase [Phenylobacterium sp.]MCA6335211.1 homoserine kinase [Phenylobacterium sp.]
MAVYTDITDEELETLLADFDIGAPLSLKGVAEGVENSNFLLETETGRFFLTIYEKRVRADDLPYFLDLLTWLAGRGFPGAAPVADRQGRTLKVVRGKPAALVTFLPGLSVRRPNAAHCREAGAGLAWLHLAAGGFALTRENTLGQAAWRPLFASLEAAAEALKPGLAATILADLDALDAAWPSGLPEGVIHADFFPDNVFFRGEAFAGAIDFYFACNDLLAYDIAVALNAWCFEADGSFNVTSARALVAGYESRRPLSPAERAALPILARGAAMRFFLTRLADWGPVPEGALVRPKSPLEYERKLAVHRESADLLLFGRGA